MTVKVTINNQELDLTLEELQRQREEINVIDRQEALRASSVSNLGTTPAAREAVSDLVERVEISIREDLRLLTTGSAGRTPKELKAVLEEVDPQIAAAITLQALVATLAYNEDNKGSSLSALQYNVGVTVLEERLRRVLMKQSQKRYDQFKTDNPHIKNKQEIIKRLSRISSYQRGAANDGLKVTYSNAGRIGASLIASVIRANVGFKYSNPSISTKFTKKNRTPAYEVLVVDDAIRIRIIDTLRSMLTRISPAQAMVIPPVKWSSLQGGGYLTRKKPLIRTNSKHIEVSGFGAEDNISHDVLTAVNFLQSVPFKIHHGVLAVMTYAFENKDDLNGILPTFIHNPDNMKADLEEALERFPVAEDLLTDWRKESEANELEFKRIVASRKFTYRKELTELPGKRRSAENVFRTAAEYSLFEKIYFPAALDSRGRYYPMATESGLTPQGSDIAKGLITFAQKKALGEEGVFWMKIQLAGTFGNKVDKLSYEGRVAWVEEHKLNILLAAKDPIRNRWWTTADDPWQFLQAIIEYSNAAASGNMETYESSLKVALDGTCNGLQHYGAMGRSGFEATNTNLIKTDKPADMYTEVLKHVIEKLREKAVELSDDSQISNLHNLYKAGKATDKTEFDPKLYVKMLELHAIELLLNDANLLSRSIVKRPVMTTPYSVTKEGMSLQIEKQLSKSLDENNVPLPLVYGQSKIQLMSKTLGFYIFEVMGELAQGASKCQNFFKELARVCAKQNETMRWTTPDGLTVANVYYEQEDKTLKTTVMGDLQIKEVQYIETETGKITTRRQIYKDSLEADQSAKKEIRTRYKVIKNPEAPIVDARACTNAIAPNVIHSLDGTHLRSIARDFASKGLDIVTVHDSFGTHACDAGVLSQVARETFFELYDRDMLNYIKESVIRNANSDATKAALRDVELPEIGMFDLTEVLEAEYLFS